MASDIATISLGAYGNIRQGTSYFQFKDALSLGASARHFVDHVEVRAEFHQTIANANLFKFDRSSIQQEYLRFESWISEVLARGTPLRVISEPTLDGALFECFLSNMVSAIKSDTHDIMFSFKPHYGAVAASASNVLATSDVVTPSLTDRVNCWTFL